MENTECGGLYVRSGNTQQTSFTYGHLDMVRVRSVAVSFNVGGIFAFSVNNEDTDNKMAGRWRLKLAVNESAGGYQYAADHQLTASDSVGAWLPADSHSREKRSAAQHFVAQNHQAASECRLQDGGQLFDVLRRLTWVQWAHFWSGWLAWTCDAVDFFSVSLSVTRLTEQFGKETNALTTAITLTLLFRTAGAIIFGVISDRYGRKWPLVANLFLVAGLQLGSGFVQTFRQFLAVRSLFGIAMGGVWGVATSCALENLPAEVRGLASGVLQQGYAVGYLIAAVINLWLVPEVSQSWRALFWTAAGLSIFAGFVRMMLPESEIFLRAKKHEENTGRSARDATMTFMREAKDMLKKHWLLSIYAVVMMSGFNFLPHGSQDLYPTFLQKSKGLGEHDSTVATIIGNCGAIAGGAVAGFLSHMLKNYISLLASLFFSSAHSYRYGSCPTDSALSPPEHSACSSAYREP
ncbi:hypothetical protein NM688_g7614 [Phlebia brevispora]|uniref:Uncharacterized protein n=1 Tax=Phlebia brevispora TaxID=194682 RepID=A0ACC1S359_9APHY|nr:hypothetical protein NM688_g7614 [Phlebia brevispora]